MEKVYDPIYATELIKTWKCTEGFLNMLFNNGELTPYECEEIRIEPKTNKSVAFCNKIHGCLFFGDVGYSPDRIIFPRDEVKMYESKNEEILWNKLTQHSKSNGQQVEDFIDRSTSLESFFSKSKTLESKHIKPANKIDPTKNIQVQLNQANEEITALRDKIKALMNNCNEKQTKTAPASEAAQASRVKEWKGYAVVMAKVAYECGLEDRTQVTRSTYEMLAKRHGALSKQALELLRGALPEGVTKKTGGPASQD